MALFGNRNKADAQVDASQLASTLFLYIGARQWIARPPDAPLDGSQDLRGEAADNDLVGVERIEALLGEFVSRLPEKVVRQVEGISIVLDDDSTLYRDNRDPQLAGSTTATIPELGRQYVGCQQVAFGQAALDSPHEKKGPDPTVYGFIDITTIKRYLAALGDLATKVTELVPLPYLLMQRALRAKSDVYGGFRIGWHDTQVVMVNKAFGAVFVRTLRGGLHAMIAAVAAESRMPEKEVIKALATRSMGDASTGRDALSRSLKPHADSLIRELRSTLDYFETQNGCGRPTSLEMIGDTAPFKGFEQWMGAALAVPCVPIGESALSLLAAQDHPLAFNLLTNSGQSLISIGRESYSFQNKRFRKTEARSGSADKTPRALQGRRARRDAERSAKGGFLGRLFGKETAPQARSSGPAEASKFRAMFVAIVLVILYAGYDEIGSAAKKHSNSVRAYRSVLNELRKTQQPSLPGSSKTAGKIVEDKVLWTEKFLSLADHMGVYLWVTDVYLNEGKEAQTLVMEGAAIPDDDGHIAKISDFIELLTQDKKRFMGDFRDIQFGGAQIQGDEKSGIIEFNLTANYNRTKPQR